jgi:predicted DNA-binding protein
MSSSKKISVSLPSECINDLDLLSRHLGVSRSALLSGLLELSLPKLAIRIALTEASIEDGAPKRYTSSSKTALDSYLASLFRGAQYDLFDRR